MRVPLLSRTYINPVLQSESRISCVRHDFTAWLKNSMKPKFCNKGMASAGPQTQQNEYWALAPERCSLRVRRGVGEGSAASMESLHGLRRASFSSRPAQKRKLSSSHRDSQKNPSTSRALRLSAGLPEYVSTRQRKNSLRHGASRCPRVAFQRNRTVPNNVGNPHCECKSTTLRSCLPSRCQALNRNLFPNPILSLTSRQH